MSGYRRNKIVKQGKSCYEPRWSLNVPVSSPSSIWESRIWSWIWTSERESVDSIKVMFDRPFPLEFVNPFRPLCNDPCSASSLSRFRFPASWSAPFSLKFWLSDWNWMTDSICVHLDVEPPAPLSSLSAPRGVDKVKASIEGSRLYRKPEARWARDWIIYIDEVGARKP